MDPSDKAGPLRAIVRRIASIPRGTLVSISLQLLVAASVMSGLVWFVWWMAGSKFALVQSIIVSMGVLLVTALFIYRNDRHWARPSRHLLKILPAIRAGEAPIEELSSVAGGLEPLASLLQQLMHELRQEKRAVAVLNDEMRQRIATRTSAMERQIGTLRQQASRDALTGLYNRRFFDAYMPRIVERCSGEKIDVSVLMIDVDHFKLLNDTLGHPAGDELLRDIGQIIRSGIRDHDVAFRLGGDEFVVVLPGCGREAAERLAQRLTELVDGRSKPLKLPRQPRLSIGVASLLEIPEGTSDALLGRADRHLYEVKGARRSEPRRLPVARSA